LSFRFFVFTVLLLGTLCLSAFDARALEVRDVRFGVDQDKTRLVIEMDGDADFEVFVLDNPYRMVVDLPAFTWSVGALSQQQAAGVVAVRHGALKLGISRIVFDLNRPVSIQKAFVLPPAQGKPYRMVVDFANVPVSIFAKTKGKSFGELDSFAPPLPKVTPQNTEPPRMAGAVPVPQRKNFTPRRVVEKPLVIIDPGHGGVDPGAIASSGLQEKKVVLALAKQLRAELEGTGRYRVKMTREKDQFIKLRDRVEFARKHKGDLFVSIHADSIDKKHVRGASIYTLSEKASDKQTARLAARENKVDLIAGIDLSTEDEDVVNILVDLARRDTMNQSKFFAGKLVSTLPTNGVKMLERPHRYAGFAVLKAPDIPSILVEAGFMSNSAEAQRLNTKAYRQKVARGLRKGIDAYFEQVRKNQRE
jgi:N-acetylmuramoyl-L-alanine amidase